MTGAIAERIVKGFFHAYLVERDMDKAGEFLSDSIQWVGTGKQEIVTCKQEAMELLYKENEQDPDPYRIVFLQSSANLVLEFCGVVLQRIRVQRCVPAVSLEIRVTAAVAGEGEAGKIISIHASAPAENQQEGEFFPTKSSEESRSDFEKRVNIKATDLLSRSIPGGMMGGYIEEDFPLYYVNDRMLSYLNYTYDEFVAANGGSIINCIHPEDAKRVKSVVERALAEGLEFEVRYRMRKKDGGYLWVNDIGKKVRAEDGRDVCISTIRDITAEVQAQSDLRMKEEQFRIAAMQSNDIIFQYIYATKQILTTKEIADHFGVSVMEENIPYSAVEQGIILDAYRDEYIRLHEAMLGGAREAKGIVGLRSANGDETIFRLTFTAVYDETGTPVRAVGIYHDISAELEKEERNRQTMRQKERYDKLFQSVLCGIVQYRLQKDGTVEYKNANDEAIRIFGYTYADFWAKDDWKLPDLIAEEDRERVLRECSMLKNVGDKKNYEYRLLQKDETACWIIGSAEIIRDIDDEVLIQSVFLDVNSRKLAELENQKLFGQIAASNELLKYSLMNTGIREFYYYPQEGTLVVPERTREYFGCRERYENMPYSFAKECVAEEGRKAFCEMYRSIHAGIESASCEFEISTKRGIWCRNVISAVKTATETIPAVVVGIAEDITKEKNTELENIQLQAIYDFTMNHDYEYLCIVDVKKGTYARRVSSQLEHSDIPSAGLYEDGKILTAEKNIFPEDRERYIKAISLDHLIKVLEKEEVFQIGCRSNENPPRYKELSACYFNGNRDMILITQRDVHDMVMREEQSRQALKDAYDAAKRANQAKSEFLSRMSHDIRTPMNAIVGMTAIAASHMDDSDRLTDCLNKITVSSKHLLNLINEVLDMSKIESGRVNLAEEEFNLPDLVQGLLTMVRPSVEEKRHRLVVRIEHVQHEAVIGDSLRIQQIFVNLMSNSVKYTPEGGKVLFTIREQPSKLKDYGCYEFIFEDNGFGMDEAFIKKMFEPFERSSDERVQKVQGTGLGLAIARNIVQMMYGDIHAESQLNQGTRITVMVHLKLQEQERTDTADFAELPILVADDDQAACESTCSMLDELGMQGEWALSGQEAIDRVILAHQKKRDYFAVILDWKMPEMDGVETARRIRKKVGENVPIIVISAYDWSEIESEAGRAGVDAFISKPLFKSTLVHMLHRFSGGAEQGGAHAMEAAKVRLDGKRILVAEDNELNLEIAVEILQQTGVEIETARNGKEAVEQFMASPEGFYNMIFMDIQMPVMDGYGAVRAIRGLDRADAETVPIVAMTANAFAEDVRKCRQAGMNAHIAKPIDLNELYSVLKKWIQ